MKTGDSLLSSQEPSTGLCCEPVESRRYDSMHS